MLTHWGLGTPMCLWTGLSLFQVMACHPFGPSHHINQCSSVVSFDTEFSVIRIKMHTFSAKKTYLQMSSASGTHLFNCQWIIWHKLQNMVSAVTVNSLALIPASAKNKVISSLNRNCRCDKTFITQFLWRRKTDYNDIIMMIVILDIDNAKMIQIMNMT